MVEVLDFQLLSPSHRGFKSRLGQKLSCGEVFQLICCASVVLPIHANISIFMCVGSSCASKRLKSPYDPEGVDATENPINEYMPTVIWRQCSSKLA